MKRYKPYFKEAAYIDLDHIFKRIKDFKRDIISADDMIEGILIDIGMKNNKKLGSRILDHIDASLYSIRSDSELKDLAKEIYYNYDQL